MITTSSKYKTVIAQNSRHFEVKLVINNRTYAIVRNLNLKGGTNSSDEITFGDTVSSFIECDIYGVEKLHILNGQEAILYIGLELNDGVEWIQRGIFTIENSKRSNEYVKITAYDNFYKCQRIFASSMKGNQKVSAIIQEACNKVGIGYTGTFEDVTYNVDLLSGMTVREAIGVLAAYCGKNATIDSNGKVKFVWYTDTSLTLSPSRYADPIDMKEEDTFINKLECAVDDKNSISLGTGIGIFFSCPGMTKERLQVLYDRVKGFTYRAASVEWKLAQPEVESGDLVKVLGVDGTLYKIPLMEYNFSCDGGYYGTIVSKGKSEEEKTYEYKGPLQKKVERSYSEIIATKTLLADTIIAYEGNFETITTNYLNVSKKITAVEGEFETLTTKVIESEKTITNELLAISAKINTLETVDLKAITATIAQANIDIGKINTLLAGTVTAGSGQYININAKNALFDNAFFKQLVATNVTAVDIFGERISTNQFKVGSDNGNLLITDNTIQIKDANRPRVQIGKDASGDYNIYVWDKVGKLMFDATGITADGIQKPIIRDDMVATNANISGDKLNITSVITKINANSTLIESSHVKYDGKSLDVAFNSLQTTVENIDIGTRNLISNTTPTVLTNWILSQPSNKTAIVDEPTSLSGKAITLTINTVGVGGLHKPPMNHLVVGNKYSWSVWVKCSKNINLNIGHEQGGTKICSVATEWKKFTHTFTATSTQYYSFVFYVSSGYSWTVGDVLSVHSLILVDGNKPPASWTSAPEDTDGQIATLTESIKSQSTQISVAQGQIGTLITDVSQSKSDIATVKGGLTTATGNISTLQSNYSTLNQTVSGLSATVGSHTSSITTLTGTANTALTNANNANTKIDNLRTSGLGMKVNYSTFNKKNDAECYLHGYDNNGTPTDIDGWIIWNNTKLTIPKGMWVNPNLEIPFNTLVYLVFDNGGARIFNAWFDAGTKKWKFSYCLSAPVNSGVKGDLTWNENHIILGYYVNSIGNEVPFKSAGLYDPVKTYRDVILSDETTTEIKTVTDKQVSFESTLAGITGRVSATESTVTTVTNTVNNNKANWDKAPTALANANSAQATANTANTQANTNKTNIATLTTTVTETKSTVATLKLDYEGFKTNVASTYTTKTEFNNLQIGGRNLALGTSVEKLNLRNCDYEISSLGIDKTNQYTVSFYFKANKAGTYLVYLNDDTGASRTSITFGSIVATDTAYHFYSFTAKPTGTTTEVDKIRIRVYGNSATDLLGSVRLLKLEEGSKNTTYSEAPEDTENSITSISDKQTSFEATLNGITGRVSSVETVTKVVTDNKVNWDKAPTALSTANTANTLANTNKTNLANLTTTVTETKTAVSNLQLDYNGFKTTVSETYTTKTEFGNLEIGGVNLLVKKTVTKGKYLNAAGAEVVDGQWFYSGYIPVTGIQNIVTSGYTNLGISPSTCYYDSNKKFIKGINNNGQSLSKLISISSGIAYIRFSGMIADLNNELKLEKGTKYTGYSPSPDDIDASIATVDGKFVNYSTTTQMNSAIDQTKNAITQTVSNNYKELKGDNTLSHALSMIATGKLVHQDPTFMINANMVNPYNLTGTFVRIAKPSDCPTSSTHCLEIKATGASTVATTGVGGFYQKTDSRANAVFVIKYLIKLPVGYKLMTATNSMGTGYTDKFLTATEGTGKWEEYVRMVECGATGTFSTGGHIWVSGSPTPTASAPLVWYLGAIYQYDVTDSPDMYSRLKTAESKLTEDAMIVTISTAINGGKKLDTTKFTMDALGLHINGGGFDISNNAGTKVLSADVSGNLTITGRVNATEGMIAGWQIVENTIGNVYVPGVADGRRTGMAPGINTRTGQLQPADGLCFWAGAYWKSGHADQSSVAISEAPFRVYADGRLYARYADISGTINGADIVGSTITGGSITSNTTINVNTDLKVGNNIYIGTYTDRNTQKYLFFNDRFMLSSRNDVIQMGLDNGDPFKGKMYVNTQGNITLNAVSYLSLVASTGTVHLVGDSIIAGGPLNVQGKASATGLYNTNIGAWTTHSNNIDLFTDIRDYFEIRGPGYAKGIYYTVSDIKFKKDVMPTGVNNAMDIINQLEHVQFNWIDGGKHVDIGYIANDVKDIMEGLTFNVKQPDGSDQYNINQTTFLPLVTKGMQELSKTLDTHDDRLTELEKENTFLKGKLACLQAQLDSYTNPIA